MNKTIIFAFSLIILLITLTVSYFLLQTDLCYERCTEVGFDRGTKIGETTGASTRNPICRCMKDNNFYDLNLEEIEIKIASSSLHSS